MHIVISTGRNITKIWLFLYFMGCVRLPWYCGKMYSYHVSFGIVEWVKDDSMCREIPLIQLSVDHQKILYYQDGHIEWVIKLESY